MESASGSTVFKARKEGHAAGEYVVKIYSLDRLTAEDGGAAPPEADPLHTKNSLPVHVVAPTSRRVRPDGGSTLHALVRGSNAAPSFASDPYGKPPHTSIS